MPLVVEDGTGVTTADSYGSITYVDTYNRDFVGSTDWKQADTPAREIACRQATQYLDINYEGRFRGIKANEDQALSWPRNGIVTKDGYSIASDELPARLVQAFAELAIRAVSEELMPDVAAEDSGSVVEEEIKVGSIQGMTKYAGGRATSASYPRIEALLSPLTRGMDTLERG